MKFLLENLKLYLELTGVTILFVKVLLAFGLSFFVTYASIPTIIKISKRKNLMDEPGIRSSHDRRIPNLGGIAIFLSVGAVASVFSSELFFQYKFFAACTVILFYIGVMDDIMVVRAVRKLVAQILVASLMVIGSDVRIRSFFGVFGIEELNYYVSVLLSIGIFIFIINGFNLIDGIDGLAGFYSVAAFSVLGLSFYRFGDSYDFLVVFCVVVIGTSLGFLHYNLAERNLKIFMGDTGSLLFGFFLAFMSFTFMDIFIEKHQLGIPVFHLETAPVLALAILSLPVMDTLYVIIVRLLEGRSPFEADKNHIHHRVLRLGLTHIQTTFYILAYYLFLIGVSYLLRGFENNLLLFIVLALGTIGILLPNFIYRRFMKYKY